MPRPLAISEDGTLTTERRSHKFGAERTIIDGIKFPSKAEAAAYCDILQWQKAGRVVNVVRQPKFKMPPGFTYIADFELTWVDGSKTVIDVKGAETREFTIKRKCLAYFHPDVKLEVWKRRAQSWLIEEYKQ